MPAVEGCSGIRRDIDRALRFPARGIEGVQFVVGREPDILSVVRDPVHAFDTRKGTVLTDNLGRRSLHAFVGVASSRYGVASRKSTSLLTATRFHRRGQ